MLDKNQADASHATVNDTSNAQLDAPSQLDSPEFNADFVQATGDQLHLARGHNLASVRPMPPIVDVYDLDWQRIMASLRPSGLRARIRTTVEQLEALLDLKGDGRILFDN